MVEDRALDDVDPRTACREAAAAARSGPDGSTAEPSSVPPSDPPRAETLAQEVLDWLQLQKPERIEDALEDFVRHMAVLSPRFLAAWLADRR